MKNLIKIAMVLIISTTLVACAATNVSNRTPSQAHAEKIAKISVKGLESCGAPVEAYNLRERKIRIKANFVRHYKCMGIDELIAVAWPGNGAKKEVTSVRLLVIAWAEHMSQKLGGEVKIKIVELTIQSFQWSRQNINVAFFEVVRSEK
jgi:hypothetical protein